MYLLAKLATFKTKLIKKYLFDHDYNDLQLETLNVVQYYFSGILLVSKRTRNY